MSNKVRIFVTGYCPYCDAAKRYLDAKGVPWESIDISADPDMRRELLEKTGMRTVPQIFVGDTSVGGFTDMRALDLRGELVPLLDANDITHS